MEAKSIPKNIASKVTIVSSEHEIENEIEIIEELLNTELGCFWLRKPSWDEEKTIDFFSKIDKKLRGKILLSYSIAGKFSLVSKDIFGVHFSEKERSLYSNKLFTDLRTRGFLISTSVHSLDTFQLIDGYFDRAFISPVFNSISKQDYKSNAEIWKLGKIKSKTSKIGLGGIDATNYKEIINEGFNGVAILGTIWNYKNPVERWMEFQNMNTIDQ